MTLYLLFAGEGRPVNEPNVHELFMNLFGGKFVYVGLFNKRTNKNICSFN
ncbi:hypothetical protein HanLR1_Chr02g0072611 [Helianthus annuus]|nr:hypothetical protein HanLR1_Chr02g0072611 [Helianthus annuus]